MTTTSARILVLNASNEVQNPKDFGLSLANMKEKGSPSFLDAASAQLFAQWLAKRTPGQSFYVTAITGGAVAYSNLEGDGKPVVEALTIA